MISDVFDPAVIDRFREQKTPFYYYRMDRLSETLQAAQSAASKYDFVVHYALKANSDHRLLKVIHENGFGADCVSGNEVLRALECGFDASHIAFAGVGKTDDEIRIGLDAGIFSFNCESTQELEVINQLAEGRDEPARIALRINPDVDAKTHKYITTGLEENKFGINLWELEGVLEQLKTLKNLKLTGLHFHIGSQITDLMPFRNLCNRVNEIQKWFIEHRIIVEHINVGGGFGIDYMQPDEKAIPNFEEYFEIFNRFLELRPQQTLHFELGRALVGNCGDLISRVLYIKNGIRTNFVILDAGMTELIRPALYQSVHTIQNISQNGPKDHKYDIVGPICESSDCFGKAVSMPETSRGDLIAIRSTGAYGEVMASSYNLRPVAQVVYSDRL